MQKDLIKFEDNTGEIHRVTVYFVPTFPPDYDAKRQEIAEEYLRDNKLEDRTVVNFL